MTFVYYAYRSKCIKYNGLYKFKHYREMAWYYKANFKTNLLRLKTKKDELCSHTFKYINYQEEYQVNSNIYLFRNTILTKSNISRSIKSSMKKEAN